MVTEKAMRVSDPAATDFFREIHALIESSAPPNTGTPERGWEIADAVTPDAEQLRSQLGTAQRALAQDQLVLSYAPIESMTNGLVLFAKKVSTTAALSGSSETTEASMWLSMGKEGTLSYRSTQTESTYTPVVGGCRTTSSGSALQCEVVTAHHLALTMNLVRVICQQLKPRP